MPSDPVPTFHYDKERRTYVCSKHGDLKGEHGFRGCESCWGACMETMPDGSMELCDDCNGTGGSYCCHLCQQREELDAED
jgi:hypothetical protein